MAAGQHARQVDCVNWHDFARCQKKINRSLIEPTPGSEGGNRERCYPDIPRGIERLGNRLGVFAGAFGEARQFAVAREIEYPPLEPTAQAKSPVDKASPATVVFS